MELINRLPLPAALMDPAFIACMRESIDTPELIVQFERLYSVRVLHGGIGAFVDFVHDSVYMRLPDDALHSLRANALSESHVHRSQARERAEGGEG